VNTTIIYRKATAGDQDAVWQVRTASIRSLCKSHYGEKVAEAWAKVAPPDNFADVICGHDFFVAECEGAVVGFGFMNRQTAELEAVFVAPEFARRGVGTALVVALEETARQAGLARLNLSASRNAVSFYTALGYRTIKETLWCHPAGFDLPCTAMTKDL
jgi:putative acetyltransferase